MTGRPNRPAFELCRSPCGNGEESGNRGIASRPQTTPGQHRADTLVRPEQPTAIGCQRSAARRRSSAMRSSITRRAASSMDVKSPVATRTFSQASCSGVSEISIFYSYHNIPAGTGPNSPSPNAPSLCVRFMNEESRCTNWKARLRQKRPAHCKVTGMYWSTQFHGQSECALQSRSHVN